MRHSELSVKRQWKAVILPLEAWQLLFIPKETVSRGRSRLQHLNVDGAGPILYCPPKIRKIKSREPR